MLASARRPRTDRCTMNTPLRFLPFLRPMPWGGRRLGDVLGKPLPSDEPFGESWDVSDHPLHRSIVATGAHAGQSLRQLMEHDRDALLGAAAGAYGTFPWLVKFLDARDWLSVQVHPDERAVRELWPGEGSKTEAWFVLDAAPGSRIYAGLLPGVGEAELRKALAAGTVVDCLHQFSPKPGDCVFLPAGTVHAVGGGVLMAEVQQTSDATFRLFDWNRKDAQGQSRKLHIEESLKCIHWRRGPVEPVRVAGFSLACANGEVPGRLRQPLVRCPYFILEFVRDSQPFVCGGTGRLQLLVTVQGQGHLATVAGETPLVPGQAHVLPATMPHVWWRPDGCLGALLCTLPDE